MEERYYYDRHRGNRGNTFEYRWAAVMELEKRPDGLEELAMKYGVVSMGLLSWQASLRK